MPEGHLIHRYARAHTAALRGPLAVSSPQGRFAEAAVLDGGVLESVEAHGKHLFYRWRAGPIVHVHLGQGGLFLDHAAPAAPPRPQVRLRMAGADHAVDLIAPIICEAIDEAGRAAVTARLGSDPLRADADLAHVRGRLKNTRAAIGAVLLDQSVIAGVGNVLRAEILNICRIDPACPARALDDRTVGRLWETLAAVMGQAAAEGRIVTAGPADATARAALPEQEGRFVYRQERCRRCGTPVRRSTVAGRTMHACPRCQAGCGRRTERPAADAATAPPSRATDR